MSGKKIKIRAPYIIFPAVLIMAAFLFAGCSAANEQQLVTEFSGKYKEALTTPLEKAISETDDADLAQFSQKLLDGYKLDELNSDTGDEAGSIASLVPDIRYINKVAMETTLKEAGKTLQDPELSEFYNSFMQRIGVDN
jgi:hypothetical protein